MINLSLFAAQELPAAIVTFVSLLMFIQTGTSPALSTFYSALLSLPWLLKLWLGRRVQRRKRFRVSLLVSEVFIILLLLLVSAVLSPSSPVFGLLGAGNGGGVALFIVLFLLSCVTAWHEVVADLKYHHVLRPSLRRFYDLPRMFVSQSLVVLTYGLLIIMVGTLEVMTHSIFISWAIAAKLVAGTMAVFLVWHLISALYTPDAPHRPVTHKVPTYAPNITLWKVFFFLLLLLPQSLMFYTRVLFLLASSDEGGLSRSIQEVGFAHGVSGALAFSFGLALSRQIWVKKRDKMKLQKMTKSSINAGKNASFTLLGPRSVLDVLPLLLSPVVYLMMTHYAPASLWALCGCTFLAQFMFGYGLHRALSLLGVPGLNGLRVPIVVLGMFVPMALSGWLVVLVGYQTFFLIDSLSAICFLFMATFCVLSKRDIAR